MQALGPSDFVVNNRGINTRFTYGKVAHQVEVHIEYMRLYADSDSETHFEDVKVESRKGRSHPIATREVWQLLSQPRILSSPPTTAPFLLIPIRLHERSGSLFYR